DLKTINKKLRINWTSSIFPMVSFSSAIILLIETIVRRIMWRNFDSLPSEHTSAVARRFVVETIWSGYIFAALFTIILVVMIYGFIQFEKEILITVPNYGKIPVKIKKSKIEVQEPAVYLPPKAVEEVPEDVRETIERGTKCKKCGAKLLKRYRFCPDCGVKFQEEATKALPKATYCVMCGEKLSEKYRFCPTCGSMLE
ncbi:MAG: zinc ribbon domain-containing protein, partial [Candidatus Heimdallarchaeaceae archaeon]